MNGWREHTAATRDRRSRRRGLTLAELMLSMTIMVILMGAMTSAIMIATNALPNASRPLEISGASTTIADQITGDLLYATAVTTMASNMITFTVADRDHGDPGPETITYAWSGTPGDPLTYQYNAGSLATLIEDVRDFTLTYTVKADQAGAVPLVQGAEEVLFFHDGRNLPPGSYYPLGRDYIDSQYFVPQLPADAVSWSITRAFFIGMKQGGTNSSTLSVQVRSAVDSGTPALHPDATVIDQVTIPEPDLTGTWQQVQFSQATGLDPTRGYHIAFVANGSSMNLQTTEALSPIPAARGFEWLPSGGWSEVKRSVWLSVSGTATVPDPNGAPPGDALLASVKIALQVGPDTSTRVQTEVQILNAPDVGGL